MQRFFTGKASLLTLSILLMNAGIGAQKINVEHPIISAYPHVSEGPGKMRLLQGYVAGLPKGSNCTDTECGYIWNPQGFTINYDIGIDAGISLGPKPSQKSANYLWYGEAQINGQPVRYAVSGNDKPGSITVCFPESRANFFADVHNEGAISTMLPMILTFQGVGYVPTTAATIDGRLITRNGTPLNDAIVKLLHANEVQTVQTDEAGHFRFLQIAPGIYELAANSSGHIGCSVLSQKWRVKIQPAQLLLRSFVASCY